MRNCLQKTAYVLAVLSSFVVAPPIARADALTISTGKVEGAAGKEVQILIAVKGVKDIKGGVSCMSFRLSYDPALLTFKSLDKGPALPNAMLDKSLDEKADPGKLALGFACSSKAPGSKEMASIEQDGVVLTLFFVVNDKATAGKKCALTLDNYRALDSADPPFELPVQPVAGEFTVTGPGLPWLWILIGAGGVLLLILLLALTRGKKKEPAPALAGVAPWQSPGAPVPSFQPVGGTFAHTCVKCHGVIQLPVAMFGQAFQCGACGTKQLAGPRGQ